MKTKIFTLIGICGLVMSNFECSNEQNLYGQNICVTPKKEMREIIPTTPKKNLEEMRKNSDKWTPIKGRVLFLTKEEEEIRRNEKLQAQKEKERKLLMAPVKDRRQRCNFCYKVRKLNFGEE